MALDKSLPLYPSETMRQQLSETIAPRRFYPLLLGMFAGIALVLSSFGIYSVMSCVVAERTHEIGVRMALGARQDEVLTLVVRQGLAFALAGVVVGLLGALALTRFLSNMLYNISSTDSATLGCVSLLLACVAMLACYIPARRATRVEPIVALRYE
jgi:putative ABC transport system permease protein